MEQYRKVETTEEVDGAFVRKQVMHETTLDNGFKNIAISTSSRGYIYLLPDANFPYIEITVTKIDSARGTIWIDPIEGQTINGSSRFIIDVQWTSLTFYNQIGQWMVK
jgi:hypothetical protein